MENTSLLIWGMLFGAIGLGFFLYGKKQKAAVPLAVGIALFVLPYFTGNLYILIAGGSLLILLPYFIRI